MAKEKRRGWIKVIISFIAGVIVTIGAIFLLSPQGVTLPPDTRGEYIMRFIDEKDNGFHDYIIACRLYNEPNQGLILLRDLGSMETIEDFNDAIRAHISQNQPAIEMVRKGISLSNYTGIEINNFNDLLPYLSSYRGIAMTMVAEAKMKELNGNYKEAYQEYFDVMRFGQDITKDGVIIEGLVGIAIDALALERIKSGIVNLDSRMLETVISQLKEFEDNFIPLSKLIETENKALDNTLEYVMETGDIDLFTSFAAQSDRQNNLKNKAIKIYLSFNSSRIRKNLDNYKKGVVEFADSPLKEGEAKDFAEKYIGEDIISQVFLPALGYVKGIYWRVKTDFRGARLRAAVQLYQRKYNKLPESLQDLADSKIISEVPTDPFSNEPFKYLDGKIYSIGPDFTDDKTTTEFGTIKEKGKKESGDMIY